MRIAVTYEDGRIFQHFGHTSSFKLYTVEDEQIVDSVVVPVTGGGHGALSGFLANLEVDLLICGGIGGGARHALDAAGIAYIYGASGDAGEQVDRYLAGELQSDPTGNCHHHGEDHTCHH